MARKKPEEKEEEERSGKKAGRGLNAGSSAPRSMAPSQGSISGILSAKGLFERNFRKKGQKVKNSAKILRRRVGWGGRERP